MDDNFCVIDLKNWKRATHCKIFSKYLIPQYGITVEIDVTNFSRRVKEMNLSFSFAFVFAVTKNANEIEEFRYRFLDSKVVLYKQINTAITSMNEETELFKVVKVPMQDRMDDYVRLAAEAAKKQDNYFTGPLGDDVFFFSSIPWLSYKSITQVNDGDRKNATPVFEWGKFYSKDGRLMMPFSIQVHHSFVDGLHVARLVDSLQRYLDDI